MAFFKRVRGTQEPTEPINPTEVQVPAEPNISTEPHVPAEPGISTEPQDPAEIIVAPSFNLASGGEDSVIAVTPPPSVVGDKRTYRVPSVEITAAPGECECHWSSGVWIGNNLGRCDRQHDHTEGQFDTTCEVAAEEKEEKKSCEQQAVAMTENIESPPKAKR